MAKDDDQQTLIIVLAMGAAALFLSRYLSSSESSAAQEYVDALDDNSIPRDNLTMNVVVKDLLSKIRALEKDREVNKDKIAALQRQAAIEIEQSKFLTSNVLKTVS
tara:strand:- start:103 stop:420 length:318 start_codon:yes stop_codon:yes gene_type:complete